MRQPISLTHPFEVISPSKDLSEPEETLTPPPALPVSDKGGDGSCGLSSNSGVPLGAIGLFLGVGMMAFRNRLGKFF
jgi:hypothetical protein